MMAGLNGEEWLAIVDNMGWTLVFCVLFAAMAYGDRK